MSEIEFESQLCYIIHAPGQNNVNQDVNTDGMRGLEGLLANKIAGNHTKKDAEIIYKEYFISTTVAWPSGELGMNQL